MASREGLAAMRDEEKALVAVCCSVCMSAHRSPSSPFVLRTVSHPFPSAVFAFPASWSVDDWILAGERGGPFGESEIDASLFPSLRSIGNDEAARVNTAFLRSFQRLLKDSRLQAEVHRALAKKKRIVFTGHSSGGSVSVLAAIWLLEQFFKLDNKDQVLPFCVTFGSPLVGDRVFSHALQREDWSCCFLHFVTAVDAIPRSLLAPLSSFKQEFQAILHFLCPKSLCFSLNTIGEPLVILFYGTMLRNALSISSHRACLIMGCTNPLLEVIPGLVKLTPYRPFGTYVFCSNNGRLVSLKNPDAILQVLFYSFQLTSKEDLTEVAYRSLEEHLLYEPKIKDCLAMQDVVSVDCLEAIPLSLNDGISDQMQSIETMLEDLQLSLEARLCLRAAGEWESQKLRNQAKIDANYSKIQEALSSLSNYRATCEIRGLGYYDTFKLQKDREDFDANVRRLELAGLWDEIVEMLRRHELPDNFEGRTDWVELGTSYRCLVEPLDIANYYRHAKNEDTGPYMVKGRPRRYKYTQRWLEQANRMPPWSSVESCFWAEVEELCIDSSSSKPFEEMKGKVLELEKEASMWLSSGKLGKDVLLEESTFVKWWKTLPIQHTLGSCISRLMNGENISGS